MNGRMSENRLYGNAFHKESVVACRMVELSTISRVVRRNKY